MSYGLKMANTPFQTVVHTHTLEYQSSVAGDDNNTLNSLGAFASDFSALWLGPKRTARGGGFILAQHGWLVLLFLGRGEASWQRHERSKSLTSWRLGSGEQGWGGWTLGQDTDCPSRHTAGHHSLLAISLLQDMCSFSVLGPTSGSSYHLSVMSLNYKPPGD